MIKKYLLTLFLLQNYAAWAEVERLPLPPRDQIGNFSHKLTPATIFGFGQNIVDKYALLFYPYFNFAKGTKSSSVTIIPGLLYGITDSFSLYVALPLIPSQKVCTLTSRGLGNLFMQFEYAFMNYETEKFQTQATIVFNIAPPTTHLSHVHDLLQTTTSVSVPTRFFVGSTISYLSSNWYAYAAIGATLPMAKDNGKEGNSIFYQGGFGHYLGHPFGLTLTGMIEMSGIYDQHDRYCSQIIANTGDNFIYGGPALSLSADRWKLEGGIQYPMLQQFQGTQAKQQWRSIILISWLF